MLQSGLDLLGVSAPERM
ncbi:MAG: hypothetical protein H0U02_15900 [Rubrobacter sp.]|nr:hypothetical protein [Rubrobacter sp.]